ncbi:putative aldose 1-epimerase [Phaeomoniella chlamydospora]|uniref:Putative aldose 1-epimerase n=1 Tax=Phaeomoniella chlamydospora TaxID=158046 RepID=A0A0G2H3Z2_PHACM|nr:putative aldose 1-epimerase [Phaeomoniella chlamydospora]
MLFSSLYLLCICTSPLLATAQTSTSSSPLTVYTLTADNITAKFIPYGARLTSLLVPDRDGNEQDVVLGYDNSSQYPIDTVTNHTYFGPVVGRFANRIKNGTFTLNGQTYHIPENENGGKNTLHGGTIGYDQRNWTVTAYTNTSITFTLLDTAFEGFPGTVLNHATYTLSSETLGSPWGIPHPRLTARTVTVPLDSSTPIMTANHIYWNLNGFSASTILNDTTLYMPYSQRYIQTDSILIPNGTFGTVSSKPVLDFTTPKLLGNAISDPSAQGICGAGCQGIDNAFILDRPSGTGPEASNFPVLSLWSQNTGIRLDVGTNQQGLQIYACNAQNGSIPVKASQVARNKANGVNGTTTVNKWGCLVIETQAWIDGINHPEWGIGDYEIFGSGTKVAENYATYDFSTF